MFRSTRDGGGWRIKPPIFTPERQRRVAELPRGAHPPHPKCGACGRAMYKAMGPAKVKPTDRWDSCRNEDCEQYGVLPG